MSTTDTTVRVPAGLTRYEWDDDEMFAARAERETDRTRERAAALTRLAEVIVDRNLRAPWLDVGMTYMDEDDEGRVIASWHASDTTEFAAIVRALGGTIGAPIVKSVDEDTGKLTVKRRFADVPLTLRVTLSADVCELVDTGRTETKTVNEQVTPAQYREVVKEVPVLERRCPDSLLALADVEPDSDAA